MVSLKGKGHTYTAVIQVKATILIHWLFFLMILQIDNFQILQFAKRSKRFIPRIAQVENNFSKSLWFSVDNLMNGNPVTLDAIDDLTIWFFLLFDFEMDPLIDLIINVFVMITVSTNGRGHMKVFVFTDPNGWNSITVCSIIPTFCSVTLLDKLRVAEFWGEEPRTNVWKIGWGTTHPRIIHLPRFIPEGFISEPFTPGLFINRLLIPGLFISELFISDNSSLNNSSPDYSSLNNSSLDHSSPNNSSPE